MLYLYFPRGGWGWVVITRFRAKSQFKLNWTGTELELSLATVLGVFENIEIVIFFSKTSKTVWLISQHLKISQKPFCIQNERRVFSITSLYFEDFEKSPKFRRTECTLTFFLFKLFCFLCGFMFQEHISAPHKAQYFSQKWPLQNIFLYIRDLKILPSFEICHIYT